MKTTLIYYDQYGIKRSEDFNDPDMAVWLMNYLKSNSPESRAQIITL